MSVETHVNTIFCRDENISDAIGVFHTVSPSINRENPKFYYSDSEQWCFRPLTSVAVTSAPIRRCPRRRAPWSRSPSPTSTTCSPTSAARARRRGKYQVKPSQADSWACPPFSSLPSLWSESSRRWANVGDDAASPKASPFASLAFWFGTR